MQERRTRVARDRASGPRDGIGSASRGTREKVGARQGCAARVQGAAVDIIGAESSERRRSKRRRLHVQLCLIRTSPIATICTSPIAILGRCRHGAHLRDQEREHGQFEPHVTVGVILPRPNREEPLVTVGTIVPCPHCEALVWSGPFLLRANCKDKQPEPDQHECAVQALHPPQRHPALFAASGVLLQARLVVRERVLDVPDRACIEELLE